MDCVLCDRTLEEGAYGRWLGGNNAAPLAEGVCCDRCNNEKVVPARIREMTVQHYEEEYRDQR